MRFGKIIGVSPLKWYWMITRLKAISKGNGNYEEMFDNDALKQVAYILKVIDNYARRQIIRLLQCHPHLTVTDIYCKLRITQSETSVHLSLLRKIDLVKTKREGRYVWYSLDTQRAAFLANEFSLLAGKPENRRNTGLHGLMASHA